MSTFDTYFEILLTAEAMIADIAEDKQSSQPAQGMGGMPGMY